MFAVLTLVERSKLREKYFNISFEHSLKIPLIGYLLLQTKSSDNPSWLPWELLKASKQRFGVYFFLFKRMHGDSGDCPIWTLWLYHWYKTIQFLIPIVFWHVHTFPSVFTSGVESRKCMHTNCGMTVEKKTNSFCSLYGLIVATLSFSNGQFTAVVVL